MHGRLTSLDKRQHVTHSDSLSERANSYHVVHVTWLEHSVRSKPAHTWSWWSRSNLRGGSIAGSYVMIKMLRTLQFFADDDDQNQEHTSSFWLIMIITISVLIALGYKHTDRDDHNQVSVRTFWWSPSKERTHWWLSSWWRLDASWLSSSIVCARLIITNRSSISTNCMAHTEIN